ncbi:MAG: Xaa-Pro peptidase family protein [Thermoplasmata archaeon]
MNSEVYTHRLVRCRSLLEQTGVDLLALTPGSNMIYMTGFAEEPGERLLTYLLPREGEPILLVPELYVEQVANATGIDDLRSWKDSENSLKALELAVDELVGEKGRVALDTRMWARFVLMFREVLPTSEFVDASLIMGELRIIKGKEEIETMQRGFKATDRAMGMVIDTLREGISERELAEIIRSSLMRCGADATPFIPIASSGPNGSQPHYRFGDRRLRPGDAVVLDFGGVFGGYCTDITRTAFLAPVGEEQKRVYELVLESNEAAFEAAVAETPAEEVDRAARRIIEEGGYGGKFIHRTGHGIGLEVHEEPYIVAGNGRPIENGMTFSIEPGIYLPGKFGVRIENIVYVADGKAVRFDEYTREMQVI